MLLVAIVVLGVPLLFALIAFLLTVAASLSNVENLSFGKACLIVLLELVVALPLLAGGYFMIGSAELSSAQLARSGGFAFQLGIWTLVLLVTAAVSVVLYWLLIPTGLLRAARIWVLRTLVLTLVGGLVGCLALVALAVWQIVVPRVA